MEPSEEFCLSGCTCSFSLGPGSVVEEKVKKGVKQQKKKKRQEKKKQTKTTTTTTTTKTMDWGVGKGNRKKEFPSPASHFFVISAPSFAVFFFFRLFPFAAGAWAHTSKVLNRTWCCNHLYQQGIEEIL